MLLTPQE